MMLTNYYELKEAIDELQQQTLPILWEESAMYLMVNKMPIDALRIAILLIQKSKDEELKKRAGRILDNVIDLDVRVNFDL